MERTISIGDHVKVVDETGNLHECLVTQQWGQPGRAIKDGEAPPAINVVFVTSDESKRDPYGGQLERLSSCSHRSQTTAPGRYWYFPDE